MSVFASRLLKQNTERLLLVLFLTSSSAAYAASSDSLVNAIREAEVVDPSVSVTAFSEGDQVKVSTYFSKNATDQDCKIDAVLISKAVMDLAPETTRCKVYFYNSANLREFKEVSVTSAEVKGFAARSIKTDTILASLVVTRQHSTVTTDEMLAAIKRSGLLPPDARLTARLEGDQANISTYRNRKASDQDCKIDALLLAKTVIDLAPNDIARCNAYFFDTQDVLTYKSVQVSSGDVKAFAEGAIGQDKLLATLNVKAGQITDPMVKLANYIDEGVGVNANFEASVSANELTLSGILPSSVSDREAKLQALLLAERALSVMPSSLTKVRIKFADPGRKDFSREIRLDLRMVKSLISSFDTTMAPVIVATSGKPRSLESMSAAAGPLRSERQALLTRIKDLEAKGVGVTPFLTAFNALEADVQTEDEQKLSGQIKRLFEALDSQEKAAKDAKDRPLSKPAENTAATQSAQVKRSGPRLTRYDAMGNMPLTNSEILTDPDKVIAKVELKLRSEGINPEKSINMVKALMYVSQILSDNDRANDGLKYDQRAASIRAANPKMR